LEKFGIKVLLDDAGCIFSGQKQKPNITLAFLSPRLVVMFAQKQFVARFQSLTIEDHARKIPVPCALDMQ
jgi:hypothetical protein